MSAQPATGGSPVSLTDEMHEAARAVVDAWPQSQDFPAMRRLRNAIIARDAMLVRLVEALAGDEPLPQFGAPEARP